MSTDESIHSRELAERQEIIDACPIDIYVSSINPRWGYDHKLMSYYEARKPVADSARAIIIDSGYSRVGEMDEILKAGVKTDADLIIPPDISPGVDQWTPQGDPLAHAEKMVRHYSTYHEHQYDGRVLIPIQAPFLEYIEKLRRLDPGYVLGIKDDPHFDYPKTEEELEMYKAGRAHYSLTYNLIDAADGIAVGGLRALEPHRVPRVLRSVKKALPSTKHIHALAPGTDMRVLKALREEPELVDSLDISTPESAPANNKMPDNTWHQHKVNFPRGTDISTVRAARSTEIVLMLNFMLSDKCTDFEATYEQVTEAAEPGTQATLPDGGTE